MEQTGGPVEIHLQAQGQRVPVADHDADPGLRHHVPAAGGADAAGAAPASSTRQQLREFRRYAIVAITAVAAVLSPPDPFSMIAMALPTILLYEAAIWPWTAVEKRARRARPPRRRGGASSSSCLAWLGLYRRSDHSLPPYPARNVRHPRAGGTMPAHRRTLRLHCRTCRRPIARDVHRSPASRG